MTAQTEHLLASLLDVELEVRDDGTVWRIGQRSRTGRVFGVRPRRADRAKADGYRVVRTQVNGRTYSLPAHRLVWIALRGPIPQGLEPNHRNGVRDDNRPDNLELLTKGDNLRHSYRVLGRVRMAGERNGRAVLDAERVRLIREAVTSGASYRATARSFGVTHRVVRRIAIGEAWRDEYPTERAAVSP